MQKMINVVQHYAWGSHEALTRLYGIPNPNHQPMAELWMGAHPLGSSSVIDTTGNPITLRDQIAADKEGNLGAEVSKRFGELPFLVKVLCAASPLSIQVHPSKQAAKEGFQREVEAGIPIDAFNRNYKDANHKPELIYALTPFSAMNGFREFRCIATLLQPIATAHSAIEDYIRTPDASHLATLFSQLLSMQGEQKKQALKILLQAMETEQDSPWDTIRYLAQNYPNDNGLFSPLLLNVIHLQPGQAMFLNAKTPHSYLQGVGLEVMANSDNVLRAGLTPKYIDLAELLANVTFCAKSSDTLLIQPEQCGNEIRFITPVDDFAFTIHQLSQKPELLIQKSAAILFCLDGHVTLRQGALHLELQPGASCYLKETDPPITVEGTGRLARIFNECSTH